ncbi:unnamed protein product [Cylicocyclus nassatus]|uniref:nicotinamidase n=1 Tax=Cylicocyclus nassatus TaxID=53992 RepID=A0AA36H2E7_CYLNA|nr:unnamed protein product [Cylicocyclus nassatus]
MIVKRRLLTLRCVIKGKVQKLTSNLVMVAPQCEARDANTDTEYSKCVDLRRPHKVKRAIETMDKDSNVTEAQTKIFEAVANTRIALIVVDFQNDFISGSLSVKEGSAGEDPLDAIPIINDLANEESLDMVVYTQDWHPKNHISFVERAKDTDRMLENGHHDKELKAFDAVQFETPSLKQVLYPSHCVENSWGAQLHSDLVLPGSNVFLIRKGEETHVDSYSAFADNDGKQLNELEKLLKSNNITAVLCCGLAYDICVRHTLSDASKHGFLTGVIRDCSKAFSQEMASDTNKFLASEKIAILDASTAKSVINGEKIPIEWLSKICDKLKSDED